MTRKETSSNGENAEVFRSFQRALYGDALKDEATALAVAEILIRSSFGDAELLRQRPLKIKSEDQSWIIEGSFNAEGKTVGEGPVVVRLNKADATVETLFLKLITPPGYLSNV
jgi:hypothetical protein